MMKTQFQKTMKTPLQLAALALLLSTILYQPSTALAQGSLTPPGAPAPTMKTLDQIEARTAITNTASLVTISQPGSYYLTANLTVSTGDGIDITTNGVTLDLNGFTLRSTAASATGRGVQLTSGLRNITIVNGFIESGVTNNGSGTYSGSGFGSGIYCSSIDLRNTRVSGVSVAGCLYHGILLGTDSTVVEFCTVRTVGGYGIMASTIKSCVAMDCGSSAIVGDQVSDCRGASDSGFGVYAAATAQNCYGYSSGSGTAVFASTANNCYGYSTGNGGTAVFASTANNCYGYSTGNGGIGVNAVVANNSYGYSSTGVGLGCVGGTSGTGIATGCYGESVGYVGLNAYIANGCVGVGPTPISVSHKYNMP